MNHTKLLKESLSLDYLAPLSKNNHACYFLDKKSERKDISFVCIIPVGPNGIFNNTQYKKNIIASSCF